MRVGPYTRPSGCLDIYLAGHKLDSCLYADDEAGEAWIVLEPFAPGEPRSAEEWTAPIGSYTMERLHIVRLVGKVEIRVTAQQGMSVEETKELLGQSDPSFHLQRVATCGPGYQQLEWPKDRVKELMKFHRLETTV